MIKITVLIPCLHDIQIIAEVVKNDKQTLPKAGIYVFDNNSIDNTDEIAHKTGSIVR